MKIRIDFYKAIEGKTQHFHRICENTVATNAWLTDINNTVYYDVINVMPDCNDDITAFTQD